MKPELSRRSFIQLTTAATGGLLISLYLDKPSAIAQQPPPPKVYPPDAFVHVLATEYRPGTPIGWHRDKPVYGIVVGISLAGVGRMRWRPYAHQDAQHTFALDLAPRSLYVMRGDVRWHWQHQIPPVKALRYSVTFGTLCTSR